MFFGLSKYKDSAGILHSVVFSSLWMMFYVYVCTCAPVLSTEFINLSEDSLLTDLILRLYGVMSYAEIAPLSSYDLGCL